MRCTTHPEASADAACVCCGSAFCEACLVFDADDEGRACASCGARQSELGAALLGFVAVAFLAMVALGYLILRANPLVGALSAIVAIAFGRLLHRALRLRTLSRRA